jgi:Acetyltransferase (GNAT) domain
MDNIITFRQYREQDLCDVLNLLNLCFPGQNISVESFFWKHFDLYFELKTIAKVAIIDSQIVGFICYTPQFLTRNQGEKQLFWNCAVVASSPDHRRKSIAKNLTLAVEQELGKQANYLGFANASGIKIDQNSKSINYQIIGQITQHFILPLPSFYLYEVKFYNNLANVFSLCKIE